MQVGFRRERVEDEVLVGALIDCVEAQLRAAPQAEPDWEAATRATSDEALVDAMATGDVSDLRTDADLGCAFVFHTGGLPHSVEDADATAARERLDAFVSELVCRQGESLVARPSGQFLYPPGSHLGWHTNSRVPGRRLYLSWVETPGASFLRYRDPSSGEVRTSWDRGVDLRVFDVDPGRPFWHAVWSGTNRVSVGYRLVRSSR